MNVESVLKTLDGLYPGKKIIQNKDREGNVIEILCIDHMTKGLSEIICVVDRTLPHYHKEATEIYDVLRGKLVLTVEKEKVLLQVGDHIQIEPKEVHSCEGQETWVKITSRPGWNILDHAIVR
ncbi:MAG: cupin domain-containing protein [Candidatus Dojkabacteria bacterium]